MTQILSIALHAFEAAAGFFFGPDPVAAKVEEARYEAERLQVQARSARLIY